LRRSSPFGKPESRNLICEDEDDERFLVPDFPLLKKTLVDAGLITDDENIDFAELIEKWITTDIPADIRSKVVDLFQYYEVSHPGGFIYFDDGVCVDFPTGPLSSVQGVSISSLLGLKGKKARQADAVALELWKSGYLTGREAILKVLATPRSAEGIVTSTGLSIEGVQAYLGLMVGNGDVVKVGQAPPQRYGLSPAHLTQ